jgi:eukaryotic-like serine/threonine-protein kinase
MIGSTISHYKILDKLGEGGMGIVYRAQDTRLDRLVALKFLPHHLTSSEAEQSRFLQEAKAAAALNHPNVCSVIDIQEANGQQFIVMEYVDGITLRRKAPVAKLDEAIGYAVQMGEALQAAHVKGIVHRDVKSENFMVTADGRIKVMDFGLAKLKGTLRLTKESSTVGTLAYMAPEQVRGEEADARSDIFSFGVVVFEMLTGKLPFRGEHDAAIMYSILNEQADTVEKYRRDTPADLDRIIRRALEKDPSDRYQHVDDMVSELRRVQRQLQGVVRPENPVAQPTSRSKRSFASTRRIILGVIGLIALASAVALFLLNVPSQSDNRTPARKMIVVLPFDNLGSSDKEYFADGLTEEITSKLSGLSGLGVIARQSAIQYKKTTKSVQQIGQELGVSYLLQGTVRWEKVAGSEHVRVTPQLINVSEGTQIWSQASEEILSSSFKLQSKIAESVVQAMDIKLVLSEKRTLAADITTNAEAYNYYLRGIASYQKSFNEIDYRFAEHMLIKATELDPHFGSAYAKLSVVHASIYWEYYDHTESRVVKAKRAAERSRDLAPDMIEGHIAMGWYNYLCKLDYSNALAEFYYVLKFQPNNAEAYSGIALIFRRQGKMQESLDYLRKGLEINPRDQLMNSNIVSTLILLRKYDQTEKYLQMILTLAPEWRELYSTEAWMDLLQSGNVEKARSILQHANQQNIQVETGFDILVPIVIEIADSNYDKALELVENMKPDVCDYQFYYIPRPLLLAEIYGLKHNKKSERTFYDSARVMLWSKLKEFPDDARMHSSLGIVYAGLGEKEKAIKEGKRGVELLPVSKEAWNGFYREVDLARIWTMVGEHDRAIDKLEYLLSMPGELSAPYIRIDPVWKPLLNNPRLQKVLERHQ